MERCRWQRRVGPSTGMGCAARAAAGGWGWPNGSVYRTLRHPPIRRPVARAHGVAVTKSHSASRGTHDAVRSPHIPSPPPPLPQTHPHTFLALTHPAPGSPSFFKFRMSIDECKCCRYKAVLEPAVGTTMCLKCKAKITPVCDASFGQLVQRLENTGWSVSYGDFPQIPNACAGTKTPPLKSALLQLHLRKGKVNIVSTVDRTALLAVASRIVADGAAATRKKNCRTR